MDLIKDWRSRCSQAHGSKCDEPVGNVKLFKPRWLIDVIEGCLVSCKEEKPRYFTLSYTWGQTENFRTIKSNLGEVQKPGALRSGNIASKIPKTIHDAIELTKALGETWLWVDSLCIVQDDEGDLTHHLKQMHRIFATSLLTIIAVDGRDSEHGLRGLRGISSPRTIKQRILPLAGGERISFMCSDFDSQKSSTFDYTERMWTFQERVFAKRRLTFESGYVSWDCKCAKWSESLMYHPEADGQMVADWQPGVSLAMKPHIPSLRCLKYIIETFNQKNLRFDEDVFNAFYGFHTYLNSTIPSGLVFGHPEFFFDISLCWGSSENIRRRKISKNYTGDLVRDRLPSWSWMGWQGVTQFPCDLEFEELSSVEVGFTEAIAEWYAIESPGSATKRLIDSTWHRHRHRKAAPGKMPDGWRRTEFRPPAKFNASKFERFRPDAMPKELPSYIYSHHISEGSDPPCSPWYPIPMKQNILEADEKHEVHRGYQYIWCQTYRAYLIGGPDKGVVAYGRYHKIKDGGGSVVSALYLHHTDDRRLLEKETLLELVAVVKGWSTILKRSLIEAENHWASKLKNRSASPTEAEFLDIEEEERRTDELLRRQSEKRKGSIPWMEQFEHEKEMKEDCYHVLWIKWENGVAYRIASGFVLAADWERLAEPTRVDLTLG